MSPAAAVSQIPVANQERVAHVVSSYAPEIHRRNWIISDVDLITGLYLIDVPRFPVAVGPRVALAQDQSEPPKAARNLRGVIVALGETSADDHVLVNGQRFVPRAYEITNFSSPDLIAYETIHGAASWPTAMSEVIIQPFYEGVYLRIFLYRGEGYLASCSRLRAVNGNWFGSRPFGELFRELNGVSITEWLVATVPAQTNVYTVLLTHRELCSYTQGSPNALFLTACETLGAVEQAPHPVVGAPLPAAVQPLPVLDYNTARQYYVSGLDNGRGEALLLTYPDGEKVKIESTDQIHRMFVLSNGACLRSRLTELLGVYAFSYQEVEAFWPLPPINTPKWISEVHLDGLWAMTQALESALPLHRQGEAITAFHELCGTSRTEHGVLGTAARYLVKSCPDSKWLPSVFQTECPPATYEWLRALKDFKGVGSDEHTTHRRIVKILTQDRPKTPSLGRLLKEAKSYEHFRSRAAAESEVIDAVAVDFTITGETEAAEPSITVC